MGGLHHFWQIMSFIYLFEHGEQHAIDEHLSTNYF